MRNFLEHTFELCGISSYLSFLWLQNSPHDSQALMLIACNIYLLWQATVAHFNMITRMVDASGHALSGTCLVMRCEVLSLATTWCSESCVLQSILPYPRKLYTWINTMLNFFFCMNVWLQRLRAVLWEWWPRYFPGAMRQFWVWFCWLSRSVLDILPRDSICKRQPRT